MDIAEEIYPGGFHTLMRRLEKKRRPYEGSAALLQSLPSDLAALEAATIAPPPPENAPGAKQHIETKWFKIRRDFAGLSELAAVHALCIAILRRDDPPQLARDLFLRIWQERGASFVNCLDTRWLISTASTFGDHGETEAQRRGGQGLSMLFDLIKLHDSERRLSGRPGNFAFPNLKRRKSDHPLAFDMTAYSLRSGDLDMNMLARLWQCVEEDPVFRPLGARMLRMVMTDDRSIFARLRHYKRKPTPP